MNRLLFNFFFIGLSLGIGPCLASCGPLLISYVAGTQKNILRSVAAYFLFSLSRVSVYALLGLSVFLSGQLASKYIFGNLWRYFFIAAGIFIMGIGLLMAIGKNLDYKLCAKLKKFFLKKDAKTVFIFGLIMGIMPCLPLVSVLSYLGLVSKTWLDSLAYSLFFGLGTIISPLFILVTLSGLIPRILMNKVKLHSIFNFICGLVIMFLGIRLFIKGL